MGEADHLDRMNGGLFRLDPERRITEVNGAIESWRGAGAEPVVGKDLEALLTRGSLVYWESTAEPLLEYQGHAWDLALQLRSGTPGATIDVLVNASRLEDVTEALLFPFSERRRFERKMIVAQARLERQKAEIERLERQEAFRRDFIGLVAHELTTPVVPIKMALHLLDLRTREGTDPKVRKALDAMRTNLAKLDRLIASFVTSADLEAGKMDLRLERIRLATAIPDLVAVWRRRHSVDRAIETVAADVEIEADPSALDTCLDHLLHNAVKFSPKRSPIVVRVEPGPPVRIIVIDQGRGIGTERLETLGKRFSQAHDRAEFTALGAGLGLHIVSELMAAQGGRLVLHSEGHGKGTEATLEFPAVDPEPGEPQDERESGAQNVS